MNQPTDLLATVGVSTDLGTVTVSQEDIDVAGGFTKWLRLHALLGPFESPKHVKHGPGPAMTRAEYEALPELD